MAFCYILHCAVNFLDICIFQIKKAGHTKSYYGQERLVGNIMNYFDLNDGLSVGVAGMRSLGISK